MIVDLRTPNRTMLLGFDLSQITANSIPVYDQNLWLPGNQGGWGVMEWIRWHQELKKKHGLFTANQIFLQKWKAQSTWAWPYSWFKYDSDFTDYLKANGVDVGNMVSKVTQVAQETVKNAGDIIIDAGDGIKSTIKVSKVLLPLLVVGIVGGASYYMYKNYLKGDDRVKIYGQKV